MPCIFLRLDESEIYESEGVQPGVILDFDNENRVVGVEILQLSKRVKTEKNCSIGNCLTKPSSVSQKDRMPS